MIECLVQRTLSLATTDVRVTYKILKDVLYDPSKSKVILILHSQGGIEGGLVLDWLLQELPQDLLSKLEIYTFGCAANHFNNPHRHEYAQRIMLEQPSMAMSTLMTEASSPATVESPTSIKDNRRDSPDEAVKITPSLRQETSTFSSISRSSFAAQDRAIGYIEHYAHSTDFVSIWGVLHFSTNRCQSPQIPRFLGRIFVRAAGGGGHQFNQHYLDGMFPLKRDETTGEYVGADDDNNEFMNQAIKLGILGAAEENIREAFDITYAGTQGFGSGIVETPVEVHGMSKTSTDKVKRREGRREVAMKELSRLWNYRNGRSPREMPPMLMTEGGIPRNATL